MKFALIAVMLTMSLHSQQHSKLSELKWESKAELHKAFIKKFIEAPDFGKSRILKINLDQYKTLIVDNKKFRVKGLELISVTDRKKPVIWDHGSFINTWALEHKKAKKRPLNKWELAKFETIKNGGMVTARENGNMTMLGALKAEASCVRCHKSYKEGDFMGAFKYTFTELKEAPAPKKKPLKKPEEDKKEEDEKEPIRT